MKKAHAMRERTQSIGEEIANSIGHGVGLLAAAASPPFLSIRRSARTARRALQARASFMKGKRMGGGVESL